MKNCFYFEPNFMYIRRFNDYVKQEKKSQMIIRMPLKFYCDFYLFRYILDVGIGLSEAVVSRILKCPKGIACIILHLHFTYQIGSSVFELPIALLVPSKRFWKPWTGNWFCQCIYSRKMYRIVVDCYKWRLYVCKKLRGESYSRLHRVLNFYYHYLDFRLPYYATSFLLLSYNCPN